MWSVNRDPELKRQKTTEGDGPWLHGRYRGCINDNNLVGT